MEWGATDKVFAGRLIRILSIPWSERRRTCPANIDLSSASPLALFLRVIAFALSLLWAVAERVYYAGYVDTAIGQSLDYAVKYAGIARRPAGAKDAVVRRGPGHRDPRGLLGRD